MKHLLLVLTVLSFNTAFAKSLECDDRPSFTGRSFSINRDGSIGFNGTYIFLKADTAWGSGRDSLIHLDKITGRAEDAKYRVKDVTLAISPKAACTNPNASPGGAFKCKADAVSIAATGEVYEESNNGQQDISEMLSKRSTLQGSVEVEFAEVSGRGDIAYALIAKINSAGQDLTLSIPVKEKDNCKITNR